MRAYRIVSAPCITGPVMVIMEVDIKADLADIVADLADIVADLADIVEDQVMEVDMSRIMKDVLFQLTAILRSGCTI